MTPLRPKSVIPPTTVAAQNLPFALIGLVHPYKLNSARFAIIACSPNHSLIQEISVSPDTHPATDSTSILRVRCKRPLRDDYSQRPNCLREALSIIAVGKSQCKRPSVHACLSAMTAVGGESSDASEITRLATTVGSSAFDNAFSTLALTAAALPFCDEPGAKFVLSPMELFMKPERTAIERMPLPRNSWSRLSEKPCKACFVEE